MEMSLCLVSAFLDIGRGNWRVFRRSIAQYFVHFLPYTNMKHEMIVFMDDKYIDNLRQLCCNAPHITIIPINREWMSKNIHAYQQLHREVAIMRSSNFRKLIYHRHAHPECSQPEYNIMQHSKVDFVCYAIEKKLSQAEYYAWTDFGYFQNPSRVPKNPLDLTKFDLERVNFQGINPVTEKDFDIMYTLVAAPERVGGFFYLGGIPQLQQYQLLYHTVCDKFYNNNIVDDDQHIMIQCLAHQPDLFKVWNLGGWHLTYTHFQH